MIQVTFCSKQLFEKKKEVDVSLRLPADAETMKRYLEAAGVRDMDDLLISDFRIHGLYAWSCGEYQEWGKADLNELNYLAARLEELLEEEQDEMYDALLCMHHPKSAADMINLSYGFDKVSYDPSIRNEQELGEHLVKNNLFAVPEDMKSFVNYKKVGQIYLYTMNLSKDAGMMQVDENGCICDSHKEQERYGYYDGVNVPEEYMILTEEVFEDQAQQHIQS